ncbi:hypothetical protein NQ176_g397 [Zarea fungicola]|uniref:Uncharacterized protein n=1 Tax=Zarea fungicola TaxID=93591 RepID=A0ACC1NYJ7_9HYPO|nr:hypothetical protein NQ176_g397 [Lecanicillium fungicola]
MEGISTIVHAVVVLLLIIELGLTAYLVSQASGTSSRFNFMLFNSLWTLVVIIYTGVIKRAFTGLYHTIVGLRLLAKLRLLRVTLDEEGRFVETSNFTLLNLWLVWRGPLREDRLATEITVLQLVLGLFGLFARHRLALLVFKEDNWSTVQL